MSAVVLVGSPDVPDVHRGGPCPATGGSPGVFVTIADNGDGTSTIECPSDCGTWVEFETETGKVLARG